MVIVLGVDGHWVFAPGGSLVNDWWLSTGYGQWHGRWVGCLVELSVTVKKNTYCNPPGDGMPTVTFWSTPAIPTQLPSTTDLMAAACCANAVFMYSGHVRRTKNYMYTTASNTNHSNRTLKYQALLAAHAGICDYLLGELNYIYSAV